MHKDCISPRQLMVLLFVALLSPAVRVMPSRTAELAGEGGWLSALVALPIMLALVWLVCALVRDTGVGAGLGEVFQRVLGRPVGKLLTALYLLWGLFLLCVNTKQFGLRFLSTGYGNGPLPLFLVVLMGVVLWLARKKLSAFARTGEIFYLALTVVLGLTLVFGLFGVEAKHVFPIWVGDAPRVLRAGVPTVAVLGYGIFAAFLVGGVQREQGGRRRCLVWTTALCFVLTVLQFVAMGHFGPALTGRLDTPYFMMVKSIGVEGAFERIESVVVALWVLSDLVFLTLLVFACCAMAQSVLGLKESKHAAAPVVGVGLIGALILFPDAFALANVMESVVVVGNLVMAFVIPTGVFLVAKIGRRQ